MTGSTGRHASSRPNRYLLLVAMALGILASGFTVLAVSRAAFSDTTSNSGNAFSTGSVVLTDDDGGSALFNVSNMVPGQPAAVGCITVTYSGTIPNSGAVNLYSGGITDPDGLAAELNLLVEEGTAGSTCASFTATGTDPFTGTLATFTTTHIDYTGGVGAWDPASTPESRPYRFTVTLPTTASDNAQGKSITNLVFTWEVQS